MNSDTVRNEVERARKLAGQIDELLANGQELTVDDRGVLVMGYLALLFDYHDGLLTLMERGIHGSAFALMRSIVEAVIRAHVALMGSEADVRALREDNYRVDFATVGQQIDTAFGLEGLMERLLKSRNALHSYSHAGLMQISRRYTGTQVKPNYKEGAIIEAINLATSALFMAAVLVTKHFKLEEQWKTANELYEKWGDAPKGARWARPDEAATQA